MDDRYSKLDMIPNLLVHYGIQEEMEKEEEENTNNGTKLSLKACIHF